MPGPAPRLGFPFSANTEVITKVHPQAATSRCQGLHLLELSEKKAAFTCHASRGGRVCKRHYQREGCLWNLESSKEEGPSCFQHPLPLLSLQSPDPGCCPAACLALGVWSALGVALQDAHSHSVLWKRSLREYTLADPQPLPPHSPLHSSCPWLPDTVKPTQLNFKFR